MQYYFRIADVRIRVGSLFPLRDTEKMREFLWDAAPDEKPDLDIIYSAENELPAAEDIRYEEDRRLYTGQGNTAAPFFSARTGRPPYAWVPRDTLGEGRLICHYLPGNEAMMDFKKNVVNLMDIEATMLHFNAIILHASLIRWNGISVIFSAPSGTGKSTQAELWKQYAGAEILNGDRAALRRNNGIWHGYGLPYAGTSGIYRNESAPLRAVAVLRQASENSIRKLSASEAFRYLYPETLIHRWDPDFENRATELLLEIISEIPMYLLSCRPEREAVELMKNQVETQDKPL